MKFVPVIASLVLAASLSVARADIAVPIERSLPDTVTATGTVSWSSPATRTIDGAGGEVARFRMAYDDTNLIVRMHVRDSSPLKNSTSPNDPAMMLKGGDAIGLTFGPKAGDGIRQRILVALLDGHPVAVDYRASSPVKQPYTFRSPVGSVTLDYVAVRPDVVATLTPSGDGYDASVQVPWSLIGMRPSATMELAFDTQVILSDAAGQRNEQSYWWYSIGAGPSATVDLPTEAQLYPELWGIARLVSRANGAAVAPALAEAKKSGVPITFTLVKDSRVSLNIVNDSGWIYRELLAAAPMTAGAHTVYWDGRDEYGDPMPPGNYGWKLGSFQPIGSRRIGGAGSSAHPPYLTPNGNGSLGTPHG